MQQNTSPKWFGKVYALAGDSYVKAQPPTLPGILDGLKAQADDTRRRCKPRKHIPGAGWHYIPGKPDVMFNGSYWFVSFQSSEGAVLAHVEDICKALGLDFEALQREAYPDEEPQEVSPDNRAACKRPATPDDLKTVCEDLESINYHSLRAAFADAAELALSEPATIG